MNLLNFMTYFPGKESCKRKWKGIRDKQEITCSKCGNTAYYWMPWVHIAISNAKQLFLNIFHDIKPEYLQNNLNEFCYKFNMHYFGESQFERVLVASVFTKINLGIMYDNH